MPTTPRGSEATFFTLPLYHTGLPLGQVLYRNHIRRVWSCPFGFSRRQSVEKKVLELTVCPEIYISLYNGKMATVPYTTNPTTKSSDTVTELLWKDALRHLKYTNNEVLLPTNVRDMIGQDNVDKIKSRLR